VVADNALIQQFATGHCAGKMMAMLTCEASELIGLYLRPSNRMAFQTSAVTVPLFHILARIEYEIMIFTPCYVVSLI